MAAAVGRDIAGTRARYLEGLATLFSGSLLLLCDCRGEPFVVTSGGEPGASVAGDDAGGGSAGPTAGDSTEPSPILESACPADPALRRERIDCWPTRYVGRWSGFFIGDPQYEARDGSLQKFPVGPIELQLGVDGTGSLTFGDVPPPEPPASAADPYLCTGATPISGCSAAQRLVEGFAYALEHLQLFDAGSESAPRAGEQPLAVGERFHFEISLGEPWRTWCEAQVPEKQPCRCAECESNTCFGFARVSAVENEGECEASADNAGCGWLAARAAEPCACRSEGCFARERALVVRLQMSDDGQALRGEYVPSRTDVRAGRLEFSRLE